MASHNHGHHHGHSHSDRTENSTTDFWLNSTFTIIEIFGSADNSGNLGLNL